MWEPTVARGLGAELRVGVASEVRVGEEPRWACGAAHGHFLAVEAARQPLVPHVPQPVQR